MFDILTNIAAFVFVLGVMIFVHELGHFAAAKYFGIRVNVFALGFGPRLFGFRRGDTDYRVCALPLGGYVSMQGENPDEELTGAPDEYLSRPKWQRFVVLSMGPGMNVLLALLLWAAVFMVGVQVNASEDDPAVIGWVSSDAPAAAAGLRKGDRVVAIDGAPVADWQEFRLAIMVAANEELTLSVLRDGRTIPLAIEPAALGPSRVGYIGVSPPLGTTVERVMADSPAAAAGLQPGDRIVAIEEKAVDSWYGLLETVDELLPGVSGTGLVPPGTASDAREEAADAPADATAIRPLTFTVERDGAQVDLDIELRPLPEEQGGGVFFGASPEGLVETKRYGPVAAVVESLREAKRQTLLVGEILRRLFTGRMSMRTLSGPIEIAKFSGAAASTGDVTVLFQFMAMVSLQLGLLNLLPIPVLDGGHIAILAFEGLARRDLSLRMKERMLQVGFILLVTLMVVVISFDIVKNVPTAWLDYLPFF